MGYVRKKNDGEFDFENLPEGIYSFTGQEGFVQVKVEKGGEQSWNLENWFGSLDPDKNNEQRENVIMDIKKRLNPDTGIINPPLKQRKKGFLGRFIS